MAFLLSPKTSSDTGAPLPTDGGRLAMLSQEHDDLDQAVSALLAASGCDELLIARLKKRKLQIKDEIARAMDSLSKSTAFHPDVVSHSA